MFSHKRKNPQIIQEEKLPEIMHQIIWHSREIMRENEFKGQLLMVVHWAEKILLGFIISGYC